MDRIVYLDNNATTQMAQEVIEIMAENADLYGNASSMHTLGRSSFTAIEWARGEVAALIDSDPGEIYFVSGASEANNTVFNVFRDRIDAGNKRNRILLSSVEHPASIETMKYLVSKGYKVETVPVDSVGELKIDELERMMDEDVCLVSVMTGNNESGVIQPVKKAAEIAHKYVHISTLTPLRQLERFLCL